MMQGFFVDLDDGIRRTLWGRKVEEADALAALRNATKLSEVIRDFAKEREPESASGGSLSASAS